MMNKIKQEKVYHVGERIFCYCMYGLLIIYCISLILPIVWMLLTSFKSYIEYYENPFLWPKNFVLENYISAMDKIGTTVIKGNKLIKYTIWDMAGISAIWSIGSSLINVFFTTVMAYILSKYEFKGRNFISLLGIFIMITPIIGSSVSAMTVKRALGVYDNLFLTILTVPSTVFSGLHFMLLHAAFKRMPWSYAEAAFIDGAGHYRVFFQIFLPMMLPTCAVIFVLTFLSAWNDYGTFLIWLPSWPNLAYGMYQFQNNSSLYAGTICEVMAGFAVVMIPSSILFLSSQNLIVSKFTVGGLKG